MFGDSQDYAAQVERLKTAGCEQIFSDREDWGPVGSKAGGGRAVEGGWHAEHPQSHAAGAVILRSPLSRLTNSQPRRSNSSKMSTQSSTADGIGQCDVHGHEVQFDYLLAVQYRYEGARSPESPTPAGLRITQACGTRP